MDQDSVRRIANSVFNSKPGTREQAPNNIMYILMPPEELRQVLEQEASNFRAHIWFESLLNNSNPVYTPQVQAALNRPGSCVVVVGERVAEDQARWRGAGCYLFEE